MRKLYFFSNVTLGYGSPKYIYILDNMHLLNLFQKITSYELYEKIRPYYNLGKAYKREIIGKNLIVFLKILNLNDSVILYKYVVRPLLLILKNIKILFLALVSYYDKLFIVTTYENIFFGLFSSETIFLQNFSEVWEEDNIYGKPNKQNKINAYLLERYYLNTHILVAPQIDRLEIALREYKNAKPFLVENCPRLKDFPNVSINGDKKKILFQGRISELSLGAKIIEFAENLSPDIEFHVAGIINPEFSDRIEILQNSGKIHYHGYLNWRELQGVREKCNVGLVSWSNETLNTKFCAPNKLYEYIASGMFVICFDNYSLKQFNDKYNFGILRDDAVKLAIDVNKLSMDEILNKSEENYMLFKKQLNFECQNVDLLKEIKKLNKR